MKIMEFTEAIDSALGQAMAIDKDILILGEDVHTLRVNLYSRFGKDRIKHTDSIIPYSHAREIETLPNVKKIVDKCLTLF